IISPHFPRAHRHFCMRLHEVGARVLGIDQVPLSDELKCCMHDYYQVSDLHHYSELMQACHYFQARYGPIHRIESHNEHWLESQAKLATEFQVEGLKFHSLSQIKQKSEMKKVFKQAGLTPARGGLVETLEEALALAHELGYPVILKPDIGVGASGCVKIKNEFDLRQFFASNPSHPYVMEEFIDAVICSFDGLVDRVGNLLFAASHTYVGIAEVVQKGLDQSFYSLREIPQDLEEAGRATLAAFNVKERFFHFEYFRTKERLIPIEVNMRPPGYPTLDMCNFACDIDLYHWWAEVVAGKARSPAYECKYHCISLSRRHHNRYRYSHEEVLAIGKEMIVYHNSVPPLFQGTLGDHLYVARAPHLEQLHHFQKQVHMQVS
ncbi:MAG: carboxylate--amine ligase, partial [Verrucomicrobia bacterium]|nr:carboxylate--amine ligase [Verrucomicrobiota bacterium]